MPAGNLSPPLKWPGGKNYLAKQIIAMMPPHLHYVEPYFGGGSVLLQRDPNRDWFIDEAWKLKNGEKVPSHLKGCSEVVNDISLDLTNFWQVLANPTIFDEFKRIVEATPFSEWEWDFSFTSIDNEPAARRAADFFVRCRQSRSGMQKDFATLSRNRTRNRVNEQASAWWNAVEGLAEVHARLTNVVILCRDALDVIRSQDGENTLFYVDPPYVHETRSTKDLYEHEMSTEDHVELLNLLHTIEGKFLLSGYHCEMYDDAAELYGWRCTDIEIDNKLAGGASKPKMVEAVWRNF